MTSTSSLRGISSPLVRSGLFTLMALAALATVACDDARAPVQDGENMPGGATTNRLLLGSNAYQSKAANITAERVQEFHGGNAYFAQPWTEAPSSVVERDGLGPLFNSRSCGGCHLRDGRGRPPLDGELEFFSMLLRLSVPGAGEHGAPRPHPVYGGQLQPLALPGMVGEGVPSITYSEISGEYDDGEPYTLLNPTYHISSWSHGPVAADLRVSPRVAPAVFGVGLLEAIPDQRLLALADADDSDGDGISGRANMVWDVAHGALALGRFGWKAEQPTVRQQSAGAFLGDMGLTSNLFPDENCTASHSQCRAKQSGGAPEVSDHVLDRVTNYQRLLAPPVRTAWDTDEILRGKQLFADLDCAACHVPNHQTGSDGELLELRDQSIWPYTDLLLHGMGEALADGRPSYLASGREWRTPPLWGIGYIPAVNRHDRLLHDGRARGVAEAILWHGGEAEASADGFRGLSAADRAALVGFVESL